MARPYRLLLVEDDPDDARIFERRLPAGYQLTVCLEPNLNKVIALIDSVDIAYVDYRLGPENGLALVTALRRAGYRLPVVVVTGQQLDTLGENALLAGATDFVSKDTLSAEVLERVTRWAMIRSRAERNVELWVSAAEREALVGRPPPPPLTEEDQQRTLRRVIYVSRPAQRLTRQEVLQLCAKAAARNQVSGITGVLLYTGTCFMQVLEGDEASLMRLIDSLQRDPRHSALGIVVDETISSRSFGEWNMGSYVLDVPVEFSSVEWLRLIHHLTRLFSEQGADRGGVQQLLRILPGLLTGTAGLRPLGV